MIDLRDTADGCILPVKVVPGASRDRIAGPLGNRLKVATSAAPERGKANQAVAGLLARALGVPAAAVELVSAPTNPRKDFRIKGLSAEQVRQRLKL